MKKLLKSSKLAMWFLSAVAKRITAHSPKVLMYHRFSETEQERFISAEVFEKQVAYLCRHHFNLLTFAELNRIISQTGKAPKNSVVLTFDDGYTDFYEIALPILKKYGVKGTLFVSTGFINGDYWMYQDKLHYLLTHCEKMPENLLSPRGTMVEEPTDRLAFWHLSAEELIAADEEKRGQYLDYLQRQLQQTLPVQAPEEFKAMTWQQLCECDTAGVEIGSHGVHHYSLANQSDNVVLHELRESKRVLEAQLQLDIQSFCYPFGMPEDIDDHLFGLVESVGYRSACVAYRHAEGQFQFGRIGIDRRFQQFIGKVNGLIY